MKRLLFQTVLHSLQRYPTVGDYEDGHGFTVFSISDMGNWKYEALVAVHELIEKILCDARGITNDSIDEFDRAFEAKRVEGNDDEPGDAPDAPYRAEHRFAENIERQLAHELGVDWYEYEKTVVSL